MTNFNAARAIEELKAEGHFFAAGALAAQANLPRQYGCHYGMRSTRDAAAAEYVRGYNAASHEA